MEQHAERLDEAGRGYLARVRSAAGRMGELIDALLKMSRVTRTELKLVDVDLSQLASDVIDELAAGDDGHHPEVEIMPGLHVRGDATLLHNLLDNLLGNAWKFTRGREGARIEFGTAHVGGEHAEGEHAGTVEYYVRDNGAGFPQAYVEKLFRPFQRLHSQDEFPGHGIGLASVRRIVERHGGSIRAEGEVGQGATFTFTLPGEGLEGRSQ
jgi:signal transduction histidine kinase